MIVATAELAEHRGAVSMVDGGFDPLHPGHVRYFREAAALGLPVLCNVSSDDYVSIKHPPLLTQAERGAVIDAFRDIHLVHLSQTDTASVLEALRPRYYVKGGDWAGRLPEREMAVCREHGIEPVFLDTVLDSSSRIVSALAARLALDPRP